MIYNTPLSRLSGAHNLGVVMIVFIFLVLQTLIIGFPTHSWFVEWLFNSPTIHACSLHSLHSCQECLTTSCLAGWEVWGQSTGSTEYRTQRDFAYSVLVTQRTCSYTYSGAATLKYYHILSLVDILLMLSLLNVVCAQCSLFSISYVLNFACTLTV